MTNERTNERTNEIIHHFQFNQINGWIASAQQKGVQ